MCWEIRRDLQAQTATGKNGWVVDCPGCAVYGSAQACWEQCAGSPCCCAPLSVTCDFCEIYIEHRREIAGLRQTDAVSTVAEARPAPTLPFNSPLKGGKPLMEKLQFGVPTLWADHHTLKVRAVLSQLAGVQDIVASSAFRMVAMTYDPARITPDAIATALAAAGYPVAEDGQGVVAQPVPVQDGRRDPAWDRLGFRVARSDSRDVKR